MKFRSDRSDPEAFGADLAARWATAHGALETMLGIASVTTVQPSDPAQIDTLTAADRYGLVLLGISRTAWAASTSGGGDAGAFGPTINAQKVTNLWSRDIRDGCLDGKAGATPLSYGAGGAHGRSDASAARAGHRRVPGRRRAQRHGVHHASRGAAAARHAGPGRRQRGAGLLHRRGRRPPVR
ncbi:MAG: hypothetical protein JNK64_12990 [Myxococcales bacterium]|nr:hypothetical protein [Myxococcales bacterium]